MNANFDRQTDKLKLDYENKLKDLEKERDRDQEDAKNREKELMKRITDLTTDLTTLKSDLKDLSHTLAGKDFEIRSMQDRVKEAESIMKEE